MSTLSIRGKAVAGVAGAAAIALLLAACSSSSPSSSGSTSSGAALPAAAACTSGQNSSSTFALGEFLPLTGNLAAYEPAALAGAGEALSEINAAGGVNGTPACYELEDTGDTTTLQSIAEPNIKKLIANKVSAILGPESSGVALDVLPTVTAAGTVIFSPANTSDDLTGASKWYYRDPVPNSVEGQALGAQIFADGATKVAVLVASEAYTDNLRDGIVSTLKSDGVTVTYGESKAQEFSMSETNFAPIVSAALATKPDAVVIDAEAQTTQILPALASAGFDLSKTYFVDGNLADYGAGNTGANAAFNLIDHGVNLNGAKGTAQGVYPTDSFRSQLQAWYTANSGKSDKIGTWTYGAESYDAVILLALAANIAKSNDPAEFAKYILPLTGSQDGFTAHGTAPTVTPVSGATQVHTYQEGLTAIKGGNTNIQYVPVSGFGPLNTGHDPSTGYVTVYKYNDKNGYDVLTSVNSAK